MQILNQALREIDYNSSFEQVNYEYEVINQLWSLDRTSVKKINTNANNEVKVKKENKEVSIIEGLESFRLRFSSNEVCREFLLKLKWPTGFLCQRCGHDQCYESKINGNIVYDCKFCRHMSSHTSETFMTYTRIELSKWFLAIYIIQHDRAISNIDLLLMINENYKRVCTLQKKIRAAMNESDPFLLEIIEHFKKKI